MGKPQNCLLVKSGHNLLAYHLILQSGFPLTKFLSGADSTQRYKLSSRIRLIFHHENGVILHNLSLARSGPFLTREEVKKWDSFRLLVALISYKHKLRKCFVTYLHILIFPPYFCEIFSHCVLMRYAAQWAIEHTCMSIIIVLKFLYPEAMKRWTKSEFPIS